MNQKIKQKIFLIVGWGFVLLAAAGVVLPILPTTPFLIVALTLFSKSSPRFHQMLLNNKVFGPSLRRWEETKTMSRATKRKAYFLIAISFTVSIVLVTPNITVQLFLFIIALVLVLFLRRVRDVP